MGMQIPAMVAHYASIMRSRGLNPEIKEHDGGFVTMSMERTNGRGEECFFEMWFHRHPGKPWKFWSVELKVDGEEIDIAGDLIKAMAILGSTSPDGPPSGGPASAKSNPALATKKNTVIRV
jgi:hypothetical protein